MPSPSDNTITLVYGEDRPTAKTTFKTYFHVIGEKGRIHTPEQALTLRKNWFTRDSTEYGAWKIDSGYDVLKKCILQMNTYATRSGSPINSAKIRIEVDGKGPYFRLSGFGDFGMFEGRGTLLDPVEGLKYQQLKPALDQCISLEEHGIIW